jgi:hypothetical protein
MIQIKNQQFRQNLNMSEFTSFRYTASTDEEYRNLASYVATLHANVVLKPASRVVIVYVKPDDEYDTIASLGEYDDARKNLTVVKTENVNDAAENIAAQEEELSTLKTLSERSKKEAFEMREYWIKSVKKHDRIKEQIEAIGVIINNIYPKS